MDESPMLPERNRPVELHRISEPSKGWRWFRSIAFTAFFGFCVDRGCELGGMQPNIIHACIFWSLAYVFLAIMFFDWQRKWGTRTRIVIVVIAPVILLAFSGHWILGQYRAQRLNEENKSQGFPQSAIPKIAGVTASGKQIPSIKSDMPFAIELVVQVQSELSPFGVGFDFDKPVVADYGFPQDGLLEVSAERTPARGNASTNFILRILKPPITPTRPLVITMMAKEPFRIVRSGLLNQ